MRVHWWPIVLALAALVAPADLSACPAVPYGIECVPYGSTKSIQHSYSGCVSVTNYGHHGLSIMVPLNSPVSWDLFVAGTPGVSVSSCQAAQPPQTQLTWKLGDKSQCSFQSGEVAPDGGSRTGSTGGASFTYFDVNSGDPCSTQGQCNLDRTKGLFVCLP